MKLKIGDIIKYEIDAPELDLVDYYNNEKGVAIILKLNNYETHTYKNGMQQGWYEGFLIWDLLKNRTKFIYAKHPWIKIEIIN